MFWYSTINSSLVLFKGTSLTSDKFYCRRIEFHMLPEVPTEATTCPPFLNVRGWFQISSRKEIHLQHGCLAGAKVIFE